MAYKHIFVLCLTLTFQPFSYAKTRGLIRGNIILNSSLIKKIDGKSFGIHGTMLHALLKIRTCILHMLHGVPKDTAREGLYAFEGKHYTVEQLCRIERTKAETEDVLHNWLISVKYDFATQIKPFLDLGRGFKPQMLMFIEESLKLHMRNLHKSILMKWAETKDGEDMLAFNHYVQTFADLELFLQELMNFLDDLVSSCPKAKQQFIDNLKTEKEKKVYADRFNKLFEQQKNKINELHAH